MKALDCPCFGCAIQKPICNPNICEKLAKWIERSNINTVCFVLNNIQKLSAYLDLKKLKQEELRTEKINCKWYGCNKFIWPKYERKRADAIAYYQKVGEKKVEQAEERKLTFREMIAIACEEREDCKGKDGKYMESKVMLRFGCGRPKARLIIAEVRDRYPENP